MKFLCTPLILVLCNISVFSQSGLTGTPTTHHLGGNVSLATTLDFTTTSSDFIIKKGAVNYLSIINSGNVGIGTTTPASKFHVDLANTNYANIAGAGSHFVMSNPSATGQNVVSSIINGSVVAKWRTDYVGNISWVAGTNGGHDFYTGGDFGTGTSKLHIENNGNVGIGVAIPVDKLQVVGNIGLGNNTSAQLSFRYTIGGGGDVTGILDAVPMMSFGFNNAAGYSGTQGVPAGRTLYFYDRVLSVNRGGLDALGTWWFGQSASKYGLRVDAQSGTTTAMTINSSANVGIGTITPLTKFHVNGFSSFGSNVTAGNATRTVNLADVDAVVRILRVHATSAPAVELISRTTSDGANVAYWDFYAQPSDASFRIRDRKSGGVGFDRLTILNTNGYVGIGTINPQQMLSVKGTILAQVVKVSVTAADWPDYVFDDDFKLITLPHLEDFIKRNKHLPEVPSAIEIEKSGHDLGDMQSKLLRKIEELTLYAIEQNKQITKQDGSIKLQQEQIDSLIQELRALKTGLRLE